MKNYYDHLSNTKNLIYIFIKKNVVEISILKKNEDFFCFFTLIIINLIINLNIFFF